MDHIFIKPEIHSAYKTNTSNNSNTNTNNITTTNNNSNNSNNTNLHTNSEFYISEYNNDRESILYNSNNINTNSSNNISKPILQSNVFIESTSVVPNTLGHYI